MLRSAIRHFILGCLAVIIITIFTPYAIFNWQFWGLCISMMFFRYIGTIEE